MSKQETVSADIRKMTFEQALAELEAIVTQLETGDVALEQSIEMYQRGSQLRIFCEEKLNDAQAKIEKITAGGQATEPLDVEE